MTLTLTAGTLTAPKGIHVGAGAGLTIRGTSGTLLVDDVDKRNAGIGGDEGEACGTIAISGGTVTVTGGYAAAGIGGGANVASGGSITISGGKVTATGGGGAGIGGGFNPSYVGKRAVGPDITITGGNITATGGFYSVLVEPGLTSEADGAAGPAVAARFASAAALSAPPEAQSAPESAPATARPTAAALPLSRFPAPRTSPPRAARTARASARRATARPPCVSRAAE